MAIIPLITPGGSNKYADLSTIPSLVESPFIYVKIGEYTFGMPAKTQSSNILHITYPDFIKSLEVTKINGEVNLYALKLSYQIKLGDDPNLVDNILSSIAQDREMIISYGDWAFPSNIFKEEEVLITNVKSSVDFSGSSISYDISAVSKAVNLMGKSFNFPAIKDKPSNRLIGMLTNPAYGIQQAFSGMTNKLKVLINNLIATDDKEVWIAAKNLMNVWDYMLYLVLNMVPNNEDSVSTKQGSYYALSVIDDNKNKMNGSYFLVSKINSGYLTPDSKNSYELNIGYPENNFVTNFLINDTETWSILYDSSDTSKINNYTYKYDKFGNLISLESPSITRSKDLMQTTAADKSWWTKMTEFPISATVDLKGLVRPSLLVQYVKLNVFFYGRKHISSGTYIILKLIDSISSSGYRTKLELLRIKGE